MKLSEGILSQNHLDDPHPYAVRAAPIQQLQVSERLQLIRKLQELFRELEELFYLPKRQMERRYYSIRPKLMLVSRLLRHL